MSTKPARDTLVRERFDQADVAAQYARRKNLDRNWRNRRESACILQSLEHLPAGSSVLDVPTGTGRLLPELVARGYSLIAADYSVHMLEQAQAHVAQAVADPEVRAKIDYGREDIMQLSLPDNCVDAAISNRLFHHYPTAGLRRQALTELARVTRGLVVVSYFSNASLSAARFHARTWMRRRNPVDRIPIADRQFAADAAAASLQVDRLFRVRAGVSAQTYARLLPG